MEINEIGAYGKSIIDNVEKAIIGKRGKIELITAALFAGGHVLLEDVPGTGKTMLAKALSRSVGADFKRIQFTPDLLPSDLLGINFYNPKTGEFSFRKGALFTNILLADEINRATPRTQSSLLESMEEKQITTDGVTYELESPYFVIATQNPVETQGTFPLPEAQLDRFLIRTALGYPETGESVRIIKRFLNDDPLDEIKPVCGGNVLDEITKSVRKVAVHDDVMRYAVNIAERTRESRALRLGVSARGAIAAVRTAQALAALRGVPYVTPDDIKSVVPYVYAHRVILAGGMKNRDETVLEALNDAIERTAAPTENFKFDS